VLDECDEMLNMGFVDDVEKILGANLDKTTVQTLLFSATLPPWVKDITRRFLKADHKVIDLVGNERMKVRAGSSPCRCGSRVCGVPLHPSARSTTAEGQPWRWFGLRFGLPACHIHQA
jgi:ATP-dependent RNA helicase DDX21